jgi:hypothetical protein
MRQLLVFLICVGIAFLPRNSFAFSIDLEGRGKIGSSYVIDSPPGHNDFDSEAELRLGVLGNVLQSNNWNLDYELSADAKWADGPSVQSGLRDESDIDFFRAWLRLDNGKLTVRGGRQKILFGSASIFRPLGFFDTRDVTGVVPETRGVDSVRSTYFIDDTTSLQGWLVPAKINERVIVGMRLEKLLGELEVGAVIQYHPETDLDDLPGFSQEMIQLGYHLKGEYEVGYWNEGRLDIENINGENPLRFDTVLGVDYTLDVGEGLHVLAEYFLSVRERNFTPIDLSGDQLIHQFGVLFDQPIGMNTVWQVFSLIDIRDGTFQIVPQIEYALSDQTFLYLHGRWGGRVQKGEKFGRLFQKTSKFSGTESIAGLALVVYF